MNIVLAPLILCLATGFTAVGQSILGTNLIRNGDAEEGPASPGGTNVVSVPEWITTGPCTVNQYGVRYSDDLQHIVQTDATGPLARGRNYFAGGPTNLNTSAYQDIDLSSVATDIDAGRVQYCLAGYFGGFRNQDDYAVMMAQFRSSDNTLLATNIIGAVMPEDRPFDANNPSRHENCLVPRQTSGLLPPGTRSVRIVLVMYELQPGSYNDGYADNLSLVLITPETGAAGLTIHSTGTNVLVQWPTSLSGFTLETTPALEPPVVWTPVSDPISVINNDFVVSVTPTEGRQFFRLSFP